MTFDPTSLDLNALFVEPGMFDSRAAWRAAGFTILDPAKVTECMVAAHPSAPGHLFKKYTNNVSLKEQGKNYETRIAGAEALAKFIDRKCLQHVVVPRKHLHELPKKFRTHDRSSYVLVVEHLAILGKDESERRYHDVAEPVLRELLRVLARFKGLDSNAKNVQFTRDGRIAFVDLEHWDRQDRDKVRLKSIGSYLSKEKLKLARRILAELEE
jgi:hypothetical protein